MRAVLLTVLLSSLSLAAAAPAPRAGGAGASPRAQAAPAAKPACGPRDIGDPGAPFFLIGHYTSNYPESHPDRNYNMALAAKRLCGTVVPRGAVLSFNAALGEASRENGYRQGRVFVGDRIVAGYGGGVCQVASTVYNAAQRAGLPIVERHKHGLTVPYLLPGEDATIANPYLDLKVRNDTGEPLLLLVRAEGGRLTAEFFGSRQPPDVRYVHQPLSRSPFRTLRIADPTLPQNREVVEAPGQEGVAVRSWLERNWPDGRAERLDLGVDSYRPSPRIVRFGTGTGNRAARG